MSSSALVALTGSWIESPSALVQIAVGAVLLLFGRRLFWLFVAAVGFVGGMWLADTYIVSGSETWRWLLGILLGLLAALAAVFLQRIAIGVGGALAAGYCTYWYLSLTWQPLATWHWLLVAGAAVLGLLLARVVFDFGLVFLSSVAGATLLLENLPASEGTSRWLFLVLVVLGAAMQASTMPETKKKS